jgi:hypothetical protein
MIYKHKLDRLSPDEMVVLLYCVNDGNIENPLFDKDTITSIKLEYAVNMLNEYSNKVEGKKREQVKAIAEKISK